MPTGPALIRPRLAHLRAAPVLRRRAGHGPADLGLRGLQHPGSLCAGHPSPPTVPALRTDLHPEAVGWPVLLGPMPRCASSRAGQVLTPAGGRVRGRSGGHERASRAESPAFEPPDRTLDTGRGRSVDASKPYVQLPTGGRRRTVLDSPARRTSRTPPSCSLSAMDHPHPPAPIALRRPQGAVRSPLPVGAAGPPRATHRAK